MLSKFFLASLISAFSCFLMPVSAWAQNNTPRADAVLLDMSQAYTRGDKKKLAELLPQARGHALEPWAAYWELGARLDEASPAEVHEFLARYPGSYQEDRLRNDWLLLLGHRRDWLAFSAEHPDFRMGDDRDVRCYALLVELMNHPEAKDRIAADVKANWYAQREASDGCSAAAEPLLDNKNLTAQDVWKKARLAMGINRPAAAREAVELIAPDEMSLVAELNNNPVRFLATKKIAIRKTRKEIIVLALIKLGTRDAEAAARMLEDKWGWQLTHEERNWVWGVIGKQAATRLENTALGYFAKVSDDGDLDDDLLAWKVRAALRAEPEPRWSLVLAGINAMSPESRDDPAWTYWKARALLSGAPVVTAGAPIAPQRAEALALLQSIASTSGFYEQLALEELGSKITAPPPPAPLTTAEKEAARQNPGLNRAAYAIAIGLRSEGVREWNYSANLHERGGMGDRALLAAAQFACDRAIWDRCINTSERTKNEINSAQRFPCRIAKRSSNAVGKLALIPLMCMD
jgi:soluble lytic murein transglycosylase